MFGLRRLGGWLLLGAVLAPTVASALPNEFMQEGLVYDAQDHPLDGDHSIRVRLWTAAQGGQALFDESHDVTFFEGYYAIAVGSVQALDPAVFQRATLFMGISIDRANELLPRLSLRKVPAAMVADVALDVIGAIHPTAVSIGNVPVIDGQGRWVGDPTGLRGPEGPAGAAGPPGPAGAGGADADPAAVAALVVADITDHPDALPFIRNDLDDDKAGALRMVGGNVILDGGRVQLIGGGGSRNALEMNNHNIAGANRISLADPGPNEGFHFDGTSASIVVSPLNGDNADGYLRLRNADHGISLESPVLVRGSLEAELSVTTPVIEATSATLDNAQIGTATIATLGRAGETIQVAAHLALAGNLVLSPATNLIGTLRTAAIEAAGAINATGTIHSGQNVTAGGSVVATGSVEAGANGLVRAGSGGFWINDRRIFDGNGNLLSRPVYSCPQGQLMFGTDANGLTRCVNVTCSAGSSFRGFNNDGSPICEADDGLVALSANECGDGQALVSIAANGATVCGRPRAGEQHCPDGEFVVGLEDDGSVICDVGGGNEGGGEGDGVDFNVAEGETVQIDGSRCYRGNVVIAGTLTVVGDGTISLKANNITVTGSGRIIADGVGGHGGPTAQARGGHAGQGDGRGCGGGEGSCVGQGGSGGGYGGTGGPPSAANQWAQNNICANCDNNAGQAHCAGRPGAPYGTANGADISVGAGGGAGGNGCGCNNSGGRGGHGGGMILLLARDQVRVDGLVTAKGETPPADTANCGYYPGGGGGSGGGIVIVAARTAGGGIISAEGGRGGEALGVPTWAWAGGGGGGGRIKIFSPNDAFGGQLRSQGGAGGPVPNSSYSYAGEPGQPGTVNRAGAIPAAFQDLACQGGGDEGDDCEVNANPPAGGAQNGANCGNVIDLGCFSAGTDLAVQGNTCGAGNNITVTRATEDVVYSFTPEANGQMIVDMCGSSYDTWLTAMNGCNVNPAITWNDDSDACNGQWSLMSEVIFDVVAGQTYHVAVEAYSGCGAYVANFHMQNAQPQ